MGGTLRNIFTSKLASIGIDGLLDKTKVLEKAFVDAVMLGSASHCVRALNPARWAVLDSKLPVETSASYVEMQCGSAIDSINHAAGKILSGQADIIIAGGSESYSQMFAKFSMAQEPFKLVPPTAVEQMLAPTAEDSIGMIQTAENLQKMYDIPREASDQFACNSQLRAGEAMEKGYFDEEYVPVTIPATRKTPEIVFDKDEHPRPDTTMEGLAKLKPVFKDGTVTAGSASGRNDGAAFVLMMTADKAKELGYVPMAKWLSGADYGCDPKIMGIGPAYAMPMAVKRAGLTMADMDVMECNEAFAVQNLAVVKEIEKQTGVTIDMAKWNPMGGAIAFGHPNGASGARIGMFAVRHLIRTGGKYGVFGSCCGGGLGVATVIENLKL
jgi:acetyl-CoA C-acetyltransferase